MKRVQLLVVLFVPCLMTAAPAEGLRVALVAGAEPREIAAGDCLNALKHTLEQQPHTTAPLSLAGEDRSPGPSLALLRDADVAVIFGGTGRLAASDEALLREFLGRGHGLLVIRENTAGWSEWPGFAGEILGGKRKGPFAGGQPMRVINLFGHAIFTGVARLETAQPMPLYEELPADAMLVIEGTVGEATAPLAWLRRTAHGRVAHVLLSEPALFRQPAYLRFLANTIAWLAHRPIAGAHAIVQRTYLPDAYPGAIAITFPEGPTVCFDPWRGGVSQVADADFVDLRPRWLTKRGEPARVMGELFFHDAGRDKLWGGAGSAAGAGFRFKGYRVDGEYPELYYRVGDRDVRETMRRPAGAAAGLVRELHVGPGAQPLHYQHGSELRGRLTVRGARATAGGFVYDSSDAGVVTLVVEGPASAP